MRISRNTTEGDSSTIRRKASTPLLAAATICSSGHNAASSSLRKSTSTASSSAISAVTILLHAFSKGMWIKWNKQAHADAARRIRGDVQLAILAVQGQHPFAQIRQAHATAQLARYARTETHTRIADQDMQVLRFNVRRQHDFPAVNFRLQSMADGIFHDRLQQHRWQRQAGNLIH